MNIVFEYAVKVVCGKSDGRVVAPGNYWTAVNVHNPTNRSIKFRKKVAQALPNERPGPVSQFFGAKLGPDEALEIDREDIFRHAGVDDFLKGFVIIRSDVELDVIAVYTAAGGDELVETIHTERVSPRRIEVGLPDLVPVPNEQGLFCKTEDNENLIVTVRNQGTTGAGQFVTEVDFGPFGKATQLTSLLDVNSEVHLKFPIPRGCFNPDCDFRITVDVNNEVAESDEGNNFASGTCIG